MGNYKVSYKVLRQQGEDIKAVAKLFDGYTEKVTQINSKLGDDALLAEVRKNLNQLREQLVESRAVLSTAGEFLVSTVDSYSDVEVRQVKKVDRTKAHNRDFYKNPVVVASAGGAAGGVAASATAAAAAAHAGGAMNTVTPESSAATVNYTENYTDNSVNVNYNGSELPNASATSAAQTDFVTQGGYSRQVTAQAVSEQQVTPAQTAASAPGGETSVPSAGGMSTAAKAAIGVAGAGAVAAGGILGGRELKKRNESQNTEAGAGDNAESSGYDPETELAKAIARVRELEESEEE